MGSEFRRLRDGATQQSLELHKRSDTIARQADDSVMEETGQAGSQRRERGSECDGWRDDALIC